MYIYIYIDIYIHVDIYIYDSLGASLDLLGSSWEPLGLSWDPLRGVFTCESMHQRR